MLGEVILTSKVGCQPIANVVYYGLCDCD